MKFLQNTRVIQSLVRLWQEEARSIEDKHESELTTSDRDRLASLGNQIEAARAVLREQTNPSDGTEGG